MTMILGLTGGLILPDGTIAPGSAGVGKDTVADHLEARYGWTKFAFSDQLYQEVQDAYGLEDQSLLRDRVTKDVPQQALALKHCRDETFVALATRLMDAEHERLGIGLYLYPAGMPLSPRQVLQWWGTEYRRAQDPNYWVEATAQWLLSQHDVGYPEHRCQYYVNTTCRFENERRWIKEQCNGQIWHIRRPSVTAPPDHVSEQLLPVLPGERELWNCGSIDTLHSAIHLLMTTSAPVVKAQPMPVYEPDAEELAALALPAVTVEPTLTKPTEEQA